MSYGYEHRYRVAADAAASDRASFIRKTYGHLAMAILAFAAIEAVMINVFASVSVQLVQAMFSSGFSYLIVFGAFLGVSWLAQSWARSDVSPGVQYMGLGLYVVAEAVIFLPILLLANMKYPGAIETAGLLTLTVGGGLTLAVLMTRQDFSYLGPILGIGSMLAFGFIIAGILFGFAMPLFFSFVMVAIACGYILYDTSNILHHYRTDQHVAAALALFSSVALLFWYILRIVMSRK